MPPQIKRGRVPPDLRATLLRLTSARHHGRIPGFRLALEDVADALPRTCLAGLTRRTLVLCAEAGETLRPDVPRVIVIGKSGTLELYISRKSCRFRRNLPVLILVNFNVFVIGSGPASGTFFAA